jgi:hypothetical protein
MVAFQFYLQSGKQRKVGWVGDGSHIGFGRTFPGEKGSFRNAAASYFVSKVGVEVFANFHAVAVKRHSSMLN